jgi:hypothetical protein
MMSRRVDEALLVFPILLLWSDAAARIADVVDRASAVTMMAVAIPIAAVAATEIAASGVVAAAYAEWRIMMSKMPLKMVWSEQPPPLLPLLP